MAEHLPPIRGFLPTTLIDWPGRLASIIFLPGCNLRCRFCHSGPLIRDPQPAEQIPLESIRQHLLKLQGWLDGVVICGGEPTIHPGLGMLCSEFKSLGLDVKLDTNGTHPDVIIDLVASHLIDYVSMDVKAPLDGLYEEVCGTAVDIDAIRKSIDFLTQGVVDAEFRTTVCPAFLDEAEIRAIGKALHGARLWTLQSFNPTAALDLSLRNVAPWPEEKMAHLAEIGRMYVGRCRADGKEDKSALFAQHC